MKIEITKEAWDKEAGEIRLPGQVITVTKERAQAFFERDLAIPAEEKAAEEPKEDKKGDKK